MALTSLPSRSGPASLQPPYPAGSLKLGLLVRHGRYVQLREAAHGCETIYAVAKVGRQATLDAFHAVYCAKGERRQLVDGG